MVITSKRYTSSLVWFRRDLRDDDHAALSQALQQSQHVFCVFVFDTDILEKLQNTEDRRVEFIWESVNELKTALQQKGGDLIVSHGSATECILHLASQLKAEAVFTNRDYEPQAIARDQAVEKTLLALNIAFHRFKDQVIFDTDEILNKNGLPYRVFTPYAQAWRTALVPTNIKPHEVTPYISALAQLTTPQTMPSLASLGFKRTNVLSLMPTGMSGAKQLFEDFQDRIAQYQQTRDFPGVKGPSYLSVHLRFGSLSIRRAVTFALHTEGAGAKTWLNELIWREFYFMILHFNPNVAIGQCYKPEFNAIVWPGSEAHFQAWCQGKTGYPLVDAAMRQLNSSGYMHNRLRMVSASFLVKDLLVDWRRGEAYFAEKLNDYDLAANNGGWQWAASTGCDAQPWFRIFNPITQSAKFDAEGKFIRRYVPEISACSAKEIHAPWKMSPERQREIGITIGRDYPAPIVDHAIMREKALALYREAGTSTDN